MANNSSIDCSDLSSRISFANYIASISNATGVDFSLVSECRAEVCGALWGSGNPDISGIGMAIGYVLETAIATTIVAVFLYLNWRPESKKSQWVRFIMASSAEVFYDSAIFFTFAIQLASIVVLSRANFGISANGMGAITLKITWAISLLTLLPLLPFCYGNSIFRQIRKSHTSESTSHSHSIRSTDEDKTTSLKNSVGESDLQPRKEAKEEARDRQRFFLFVLCWMLSVYPFLSHMVGAFGKSEIGNGSGQVISTVDWGTIEDVCYARTAPLLPSQETAMTVFGIGSWLFMSVIVIYKIFVLAILKQHSKSRLSHRLRNKHVLVDSSSKLAGRLWMALCIVAPLLSVSQMWTFFRLQKLQTQMTDATGGVYLDKQWTFGQIVAVIVFMPVLTEALFLLRNTKVYDLDSGTI
ncbi:hypothetical protein AOQ84DRAFT_387352 [Glonium stellatum]|uniref:Uncharacterized protein n=1 Tax=Glonium stellatum TaxID=574774 RepID=A0A8E2F5E5_9PEZI|nr:hypothetical protein AOQ84DRAFT_387352 [Glonium stellatum]